MQVDSKIITPEGEETILPLLACLIARKIEVSVRKDAQIGLPRGSIRYEKIWKG